MMTRDISFALALAEIMTDAAAEALAARGQRDPSAALIDALVAIGRRNGTPQAVLDEYNRIAGPDIDGEVMVAFVKARANELLARDVAELAIELGWSS